jgi:hypothetical protein
MFVPEVGNEGADKELPYVDVAQDLDQVQKGPRPTLPAKASLGSLTPSFKIMQSCLLQLCIYVSRVEWEP